jgi:putative serine protease PepD
VRTIAPQLIAHGRVTRSPRASLGIHAATITDGGVVVIQAEPGGPAAQAGIEPGDLIVTLGGARTSTMSQLQTVLADHDPGDRVKVDVRHPGGRGDDPATTGQDAARAPVLHAEAWLVRRLSRNTAES